MTGGGRGVGRGISERFLDAGADGRGLQPHAAGDAAVERRRARPPSSRATCASRSRSSAWSPRSSARFGRLDVLVNNAGGSPLRRGGDRVAALLGVDRAPEPARAAPLRAAGERGDAGRRRRAARSSTSRACSAVRPSPGTAAYAAAKAGLLALTQTLAVEWAPKVRVNAVTAGMIRTEQAHAPLRRRGGHRGVGATIPLGRIGEPRDVGDACLFLASPLARYVSGASLLVHGGGERPAFLGAAKNVCRGTNDERHRLPALRRGRALLRARRLLHAPHRGGASARARCGWTARGRTRDACGSATSAATSSASAWATTSGRRAR